MTANWEYLGKEGLLFFGRMSASVSHEIKNVLAVVNENAGLLDDLISMTAQGRELDPERLSALSKRIQSHVKRGDGIVKRMNQFAHSTDHPRCKVDVRETVLLMQEMLQRLAAQREIDLQVEDGESVEVETWPFFLENLLFLCSEFVLERTERGATIALSVGVSAKGVHIGINSEKTSIASMDPLQEKCAPLLDLLQCSVDPNALNNGVDLALPLELV